MVDKPTLDYANTQIRIRTKARPKNKTEKAYNIIRQTIQNPKYKHKTNYAKPRLKFVQIETCKQKGQKL